MSLITSLKNGILVGAAVVATATGFAIAQQKISLDDVLRAAREERRQAAEENRQREQQFLAERNRQAARLGEVRGEVAAEERRSEAVDGAFAANDTRLADLNDQLKAAQGEFGELFGAARSGAADLAAQLENSIISAQLPGRAEPLKETASSTTLPSIEELENIHLTHLEVMLAQSKVATFDATVVNKAGEALTQKVTRVGPFAAFVDGNYYTMRSTEGSTPRLTELARQPATSNAVPNARGVAGFSGDGYTTATIDPTTGTLLGLVVDTPSFGERVQQGGQVGYVILIVMAIGILIGVYKMLTLAAANAAVKGQARRKTGSKSNALGRVLLAYEENKNIDTDTLALKLDDAILRELPKLESGLNLLKVFAAVAPLLGLLGTVVGMIITFQQITLFGTGDPKIMAGGISTALVTTVQGLVAAIPLLILHALAASSAKSISQTLDEQAAGIIAEHAEGRG